MPLEKQKITSFTRDPSSDTSTSAFWVQQRLQLLPIIEPVRRKTPTLQQSRNDRLPRHACWNVLAIAHAHHTGVPPMLLYSSDGMPHTCSETINTHNSYLDGFRFPAATHFLLKNNTNFLYFRRGSCFLALEKPFTPACFTAATMQAATPSPLTSYLRRRRRADPSRKLSPRLSTCVSFAATAYRRCWKYQCRSRHQQSIARQFCLHQHALPPLLLVELHKLC